MSTSMATSAPPSAAHSSWSCASRIPYASASSAARWRSASIVRRMLSPASGSWLNSRSLVIRPSASTKTRPSPRTPAQVGVVDGLDPGLADAVAGRVALVGLRLELLGVDLADVAEDLGGEGPLVVVAQVRLGDLDAGELALVLHQVGGLELADVGVDRDRRERVALQALRHLVADGPAP